MTPETGDARRFVLDNTRPEAAPLVPELLLHLASEVVPLWQMTESELEATGLPPPYWAFAWAGGQALARHLLDHPELVRGRTVLDFGAGSGVVGIAAAKAGAMRVIAADIDAFAAAAIALNATLNGVSVEIVTDDVVGRAGLAEVLLIGDMCYERPLAQRIEAWMFAEAGAGVPVYLGDPGRTYLPKSGLTRIAHYAVKTSRDLEDADVRNTSVWRVDARDRTASF